MRLKKVWYKILSKVLIGQTRKRYEEKYKKIKERLKTDLSVTTGIDGKSFYGKINPYIAAALRKESNVLFNQLELFRTAGILHSKTFSKYKNIHCGRDIVLIATGPTLNDFRPIKDAVYVGVNRSFLCDNLKLDYLFMQDYVAVKDYIELSQNYKNKRLKRFYGILQAEIEDKWIIPEAIAIKHNAERYYAWSAWNLNKVPVYEYFPADITAKPLACFGSVVFPAMQFIFYTNPRRIYIVGCDCENTGHFNNSKKVASDPNFTEVKRGWKLIKKFQEIYYPETQIISVNPVGLKGLFEDLYQERKE